MEKTNNNNNSDNNSVVVLKGNYLNKIYSIYRYSTSNKTIQFTLFI